MFPVQFPILFPGTGGQGARAVSSSTSHISCSSTPAVLLLACVRASCCLHVPAAVFMCYWHHLPLMVAMHLADLTDLHSHCSRLVLKL